MDTSVHFSSASDDWPTPQDFFDDLNREFNFTLDPCSDEKNHKCASFFTAADDGLSQEWTGRVFMNPPYGRTIGKWMQKAFESVSTSCEVVVCLVPARTDTAWWHDYAMKGEVRYIRGRLKFGGHKNSAPFPNAVVIFRNPFADIC
jgi:phage N-6-adenine-methyltransferase